MIQKDIYVKTNIRITKDQHRFLKISPYNLSALVRKTLKEIMIKEEKKND
jgi:hypothetical protein